MVTTEQAPNLAAIDDAVAQISIAHPQKSIVITYETTNGNGSVTTYRNPSAPPRAVAELIGSQIENILGMTGAKNAAVNNISGLCSADRATLEGMLNAQPKITIATPKYCGNSSAAYSGSAK